MAENNPYPVALPAEDASKGIEAGYSAYMTPGIFYGDGQGGIRTAQPGTDYGYPLVQGNGPPGNTTSANLGQHYFDMTATAPPYEYICVGYTASGFVWKIYGDPGQGFRVLGRFNTIEALQEAVSAGTIPQPSPGDAYFVGTTAPYPVYYYDGLTLTWTYYGPLGSSGSSSGDVTGIPPHGGAGQVLKKSSDADYDVEWGDVPKFTVTTTDISNGAITTPKLASQAITMEKLAADAKPLVFTERWLTPSWTEADAHAAEGFPFRAQIALTGVTVNHFPQVVFSIADAQSGTFAPIAESYNGGVYIYAAEALTVGTTIPCIMCTPTDGG